MLSHEQAGALFLTIPRRNVKFLRGRLPQQNA
jgi:hypothetical protein